MIGSKPGLNIGHKHIEQTIWLSVNMIRFLPTRWDIRSGPYDWIITFASIYGE